MSEQLISYEDACAAISSVPTINGRPTYETLQTLTRCLAQACRSLKCYQASPDEGWVGIMQPEAVYLLRNATAFVPPTDPGQLVLPVDASKAVIANLTNDHQRDINRYNSYNNIHRALRKTIEDCIAQEYRPLLSTGETSWPNSWTIRQILQSLEKRYGIPTLKTEEDAQLAFFREYDPRTPMEPFLHNIEKCQITAIAANVPYTTEQLIKQATTSLRKCQLYDKAMEEWDDIPENRRSTWQETKEFLIQAYEKVQMKLNRQRTTGSAHYGGNVFADDGDDNDSIVTLQNDIDEVRTAHNVVAQETSSTMIELAEALRQQSNTIVGLQQHVAMMSMGGMPMYRPPMPPPPMPPPYPGLYMDPGTTHNFLAPPIAYNAVAPPQAYHVTPPQHNPSGGWGGRGIGGGRRGGSRNRTSGGRGQQQRVSQQSYHQRGGQQPHNVIQPYQAPPPPVGGMIPPYQAPPPQQQQRGRGYQTNPVKFYPNWYVCFSHGFDVDHESHTCPNKKPGHVDTFTRANWQLYESQGYPFCRNAIHKTRFPTNA